MTSSLLPPLELFVENAAFASEHEGVDTLVLSYRDTDGSGTLEVSRDREDDPYERTLGVTGSCLCVDSNATAYDAILAWECFDETVALRLSPDGARTLAWPDRVTLRCGPFLEIVRDGLRQLVGAPSDSRP